jgi:hypothetical protein
VLYETGNHKGYARRPLVRENTEVCQDLGGIAMFGILMSRGLINETRAMWR